MSEERRHVTVVFADFVGSTASARGRDPEVVRGAYAETFARLRVVLERHGATVEKFIGDAVLAVFGVPAAHEDDPERAVRAAFDAREVIADVVARGPLSFQVRIGVSSGEAVAGTTKAEQFLVTGPVVTTAARLEAKAHPGEILVDRATRERTSEAVEYGRPRTVAAKGLGRIEGIPAIRIRVAAPGTRERPQLHAPLIGRRAELDVLRLAYERSRDDRAPHVLVVVGQAGVGKSRLVREAVARLEPERVRQGRCLPYGDAITFYPLQQMLREDAGVQPGDSVHAARAKLDAAVTEAVGDHDAPLIAQRLAAIAALGGADELAGVGRSDLADELRWAVRRYFAARASRAPFVLVFEDVHWAEAALVEMIRELEHARAPIVVICLARPEFLERYASLREAPRTTVLTVGPLGASDAEELIRALLVIDELPERLRADVVARSGGNPLFVEEFLRLLIDSGRVRRRGTRWRAVREARALEVPRTIHALIAARLDQLTPEVRRLALCASVAGRVVSDDELNVLAGDSSASLADAVARDVLAPTMERAIGGGDAFRFAHVLVRDVAYSMLAKTERIALHDRFGRWIDERLGERRAEAAEIVAYHAEQAAIASIDLMRDSGELAERAVELLLRAAAIARSREDSAAAVRFYERATSLADHGAISAERRLEARGWLLVLQTEARAGADITARIDSLLAEAEALGPSSTLARLLLERASRFPDNASLEQYIARAHSVAQTVGDVQLVAESLYAGFQGPTRSANLPEAERRLRVAADYSREHGLSNELSWALTVLANHAVERGALTEARGHLTELASLAGSVRSRFAEMSSLRMTQWFNEVTRDFDAADRACQQHVAIARDIGTPNIVATALWFAADLRVGEGRAKEALSMLNEAAELALAHDLQLTPRLLASRAHTHAELGHAAAATRDAEFVLQLNTGPGPYGVGVTAPRPINRAVATAALAKVAAGRGDDTEADRLFQEAVAIIDTTAFGWFKVSLREPYALFLMARQRWAAADEILEAIRAYYHDPLAAAVAAQVDALRHTCQQKLIHAV